MNLRNLTGAIVRDIPVTNAVIEISDNFIEPPSDNLKFKIMYTDEFGENQIVDTTIKYDFTVPDDQWYEEAGERLRKAIILSWLRTRYDAWHMDSQGPDDLVDYIGMSADDFGDLENTGVLPENWKVPK